MNDDLKNEYIRVIKTLNESIWEQRLPGAKVEKWLSNFAQGTDTGSLHEEQLHALYLLAKFIFFGDRELRELLKALYRDVIKFPIVNSLRRAKNDSVNSELLATLYEQELQSTRFLGMGNPSESGTHLLYHFRQENHLPTELFINGHEIFARRDTGHGRVLRDPSVKRYIFLDDLCASGQQAVQYSQDLVEEIKSLNGACEIRYCTLFATRDAIDTIEASTQFSDVHPLIELDASFKVFSEESRYFSEDQLSRSFAEAMCRRHGIKINPSHPLGYRDCQLLIGFHHNVPDNTLPVIWADSTSVPWTAAFRRYPKLVAL